MEPMTMPAMAPPLSVDAPEFGLSAITRVVVEAWRARTREGSSWESLVGGRAVRRSFTLSKESTLLERSGREGILSDWSVVEG
jgi:hypothetical protein